MKKEKAHSKSYNRRNMEKAEYLDLQSVYDIYGFRPNTLKREIWEQKARRPDLEGRGIGVHVPHYKMPGVSGKILFKKADIDAYLESKKVRPFCNSETNEAEE